MIFFKVLLFYCINLLILILCIHTTKDFQINKSIHFSVWGPGIRPTIALPVQYFYIKYSALEQKVPFKFKISNLLVEINSSNGKIQNKIIDRFDCSFIIMYQLYTSVHDLSISILYKGAHVGQSPYNIKGVKLIEQCYCPLKKMKVFKEIYNCSIEKPHQISQDFEPFKKIDMDTLRLKIINKFIHTPRSQSLVHYVIKDNKIYRNTIGEYVGFKTFSDELLLSLTRKVMLPDMEFFLNLGDWPLSPIKEAPIPIISWCGSNESYDLILPTYDIMDSLFKANLGYSKDTLTLQGNRGIPWQEKSNLAFFRGRDSSNERLDLVRLSMKLPHLISARLTNMFFFKHSPDLGEIGQFVPFNNFFKHKYQINMDGTVAAYRLTSLLAANSLVLKQDSIYYEHYYNLLKPGVHYISFKKDLSDLLEKLQWIKDHDEIVPDIIRNANRIIDEQLNPVELYCYHIYFFEEYSKRLISKVNVLKDMEHVKQQDQFCDCESQKIKHEEF